MGTLIDAVRLVVLVRPAWDSRELMPQATPELARRAEAGEIDFVAGGSVSVSSTGLRALFAQGQTPEPGLMPNLVVEYIQKYLLYR